MHTHIMTKELMARGHDVTLYALADSDDRFNVIQPPLNQVNMGEGIDLFENEPGFGMSFINKLHAYMYVMRELSTGGYDIVHNNSLHFIPLNLAHILPCPMVTALHTPPFPSLQSAALLARNYLGNHFVSVSDSLGTQWKDYVQHYTVVHNGIRVTDWTYRAEAEKKTAVWVGRFCPEKGAEYAIEAARLAGYHLKMAGSVYDQEYYDTQIAPRLGPDVEVVGHLNHQGLSDLIGAAEVGLFTSTWDEPFGLVLTEMLACGTPIVSFDSGAAAEIIDETCGVIVPKRDYRAMARAIPFAVGLERADCRRRAERDFPISSMISNYEKLYRNLCKTSTLQEAPALENVNNVELAAVSTTHVA